MSRSEWHQIEKILAPVRKKFHLNPPADDAAIASYEAHIQTALPADYAQFLRFADGGEGVMGKTYVSLWRVGE
jgi:cell wall assembly regulator SMI1